MAIALKRFFVLDKCRLNHLVDIFTNSIKVSVDLIICESDYGETISFENFRAEFILFYSFVAIMLTTINFNNQLCPMTVKIGYKIVDGFLSLESDLIFG